MREHSLEVAHAKLAWSQRLRDLILLRQHLVGQPRLQRCWRNLRDEIRRRNVRERIVAFARDLARTLGLLASASRFSPTRAAGACAARRPSSAVFTSTSLRLLRLVALVLARISHAAIRLLSRAARH